MLDPAISNRGGCIAKEKLFGIIPFFMCPIGMVAAAAIGNTCDTEGECGRGAKPGPARKWFGFLLNSIGAWVPVELAAGDFADRQHAIALTGAGLV